MQLAACLNSRAVPWHQVPQEGRAGCCAAPHAARRPPLAVAAACNGFRALYMVLKVHHADWTCPPYPGFHSLQMGATMARIMRERGLA